MDLVESEEVFRPALSYALGSALVCDTLEEAQELCFTKGEKVRIHCFTVLLSTLLYSALLCTATKSRKICHVIIRVISMTVDI